MNASFQLFWLRVKHAWFKYIDNNSECSYRVSVFKGIWQLTLQKKPTSVHTVRKCSTARITWKITSTLTTRTKRPSPAGSAARATTPSWASSATLPSMPPTVETSPARCVCSSSPAPGFSWNTSKPIRASLLVGPKRKNIAVSTASDVFTPVKMCDATWWCTLGARTSCVSTVPSASEGKTTWRVMSRKAMPGSCWE